MKGLKIFGLFMMCAALLVSCNQSTSIEEMIETEVNDRAASLVDSLHSACNDNFDKILQARVSSSLKKSNKPKASPKPAVKTITSTPPPVTTTTTTTYTPPPTTTYTPPANPRTGINKGGNNITTTTTTGTTTKTEKPTLRDRAGAVRGGSKSADQGSLRDRSGATRNTSNRGGTTTTNPATNTNSDINSGGSLRDRRGATNKTGGN